MLARRARMCIKPNLAKAAKSAAPAPDKEEATVPAPPPTEDKISISNEENHVRVPEMLPPVPVTPVELPPVEHVMEIVQQDDIQVEKTLEVETSMIDDDDIGINLLSPRKRIAHPMREMISPRNRTVSTNEQHTCNKHLRRKFKGDEQLDTKTMRMMDMIYWNPRKEQGLTKKDDCDAMLIPKSEFSVPSTPVKVAAPQVKIGPDGKLVIDETSLIVPEPQKDSSIWETVDEDRITRKVTSLSFRNRLWRKGTPWTEKETELFYEILRCTGPDFGLMHEFFPSRARNELKSKFNREERNNWDRMKLVLSLPAVLDESLHDRAAALELQIEKEAEQKKSRKRGPKSPPPASIDWDESKADLVSEAEKVIRQLQKDERRQKKLAKAAKKAQEEKAAQAALKGVDQHSSDDDDDGASSSSDDENEEEAADDQLVGLPPAQKKRKSASKDKNVDGMDKAVDEAAKAMKSKILAMVRKTVGKKTPAAGGSKDKKKKVIGGYEEVVSSASEAPNDDESDTQILATLKAEDVVDEEEEINKPTPRMRKMLKLKKKSPETAKKKLSATKPPALTEEEQQQGPSTASDPSAVEPVLPPLPPSSNTCSSTPSTTSKKTMRPIINKSTLKRSVNKPVVVQPDENDDDNDDEETTANGTTESANDPCPASIEEPVEQSSTPSSISTEPTTTSSDSQDACSSVTPDDQQQQQQATEESVNKPAVDDVTTEVQQPEGIAINNKASEPPSEAPKSLTLSRASRKLAIRPNMKRV